MSKHLIRTCAALALGAALMLGTAGCATTVRVKPAPRVAVVKPAPVVVVKAPAPRYVWVSGHWTGHGRHRHWVPGHYRRS